MKGARMADEDQDAAVAANEVVGHTPTTGTEKTIEVEVDGRDAIVSIGRERIRLDRHSIPALQLQLQRAFMEVS
jgi:hypothetical protein